MTLTREGIAYRVACDLPEGSYVNLGIGIPTLVPGFLPADKEIFIHSENGVLGVGPMSAPGTEDPDLVNASKQYVTLVPGGSVFDHALSFAMIRGGHITHSVIGAIEVAANGDLANWRVPGEKVPGVGGAMDLAFGVRNLYVAMNHVTNKGEPKILNKCTCPLTAPRCVRRIYTDLALIEVTPDGLVLREVAPGLDASAVQAKTEAPLRVAGDCREMIVPAEVNGIKLSA
ncbi:MAG: succinyl-CoA--3-ketoacid-CoA transferase [Betaproteobacteria bacterium RBG_16_64_18]|nr:MAG: succinyl-CoA--3-ketoacid-CoA transferase [Betaproteobacteria bacterium RBG_16_64_18]OGA12529.1 MAG: succinyl-CoA--3-ketoacid-CoA transferase [Betaproteobacteria bacterium RIFCSPLOWO2_02_FULL_65_20]